MAGGGIMLQTAVAHEGRPVSAGLAVVVAREIPHRARQSVLIAIPAFDDNYFWLQHDGRDALVVDPGVAAPVQAALDAHGLALRAILVTHHHPDHIGGVAELARRHGPRIIGPLDPRIGGLTEVVGDGARVALDGPAVAFTVLAVPGHTATHVAFHGDQRLYVGDTLFSLGCGRLFEGSPAQMLDSLDRIAALPPATEVCCAHEYTLANAAFALTVEPGNPALQARVAQARAQRAAGQPTLPMRLGEERECNPFLRVDVPAVRARVAEGGGDADSRVGTFASLRGWKDRFRPGQATPWT